MSSADEEEEVFYVVSRGRVADFLTGLALPVFAWPGQWIFRVVLHGHGFVHEVEGLKPRIGFYITYFTAASTVRAAEARAVHRLRERWENFYDDATGPLLVDVEETEQLDNWFLARSRRGFAFYSSDD